MDYLNYAIEKGVAILTIKRGKVNAINEQMVDEFKICFEELENDSEMNSIILIGIGKFFSFGFDIPEFMDYSKEDFTRYLIKFTNFYKYLYLFPKPVIAAVNGHAIAGGCMLATKCDYRIMTTGKAKISLNEVTFGSTVFAGSAEILKSLVGQRNASKILLTGDMYSAEQALEMGLVDEVASEADLLAGAMKKAIELGQKEQPAFSSLKQLCRKSVIDNIDDIEKDSIAKFVDIWYSDKVRKNLSQIKIHS